MHTWTMWRRWISYSTQAESLAKEGTAQPRPPSPLLSSVGQKNAALSPIIIEQIAASRRLPTYKGNRWMSLGMGGRIRY